MREPDPSSIFWGGDGRGILMGGRLPPTDWGRGVVKVSPGSGLSWLIYRRENLVGDATPFCREKFIFWAAELCHVAEVWGPWIRAKKRLCAVFGK